MNVTCKVGGDYVCFKFWNVWLYMNFVIVWSRDGYLINCIKKIEQWLLFFFEFFFKLNYLINKFEYKKRFLVVFIK